MYLEGSEFVTYTPVEAYGVSTYDVGIISGGGGDEATVIQSTRFFWVYDPEHPDKSGFTGQGWFADVPNTPLNYSNITEDELLRQFQEGDRINLNDVFQAWQILVSSQIPGKTDYVGDFIDKIDNRACWSLNA